MEIISWNNLGRWLREFVLCPHVGPECGNIFLFLVSLFGGRLWYRLLPLCSQSGGNYTITLRAVWTNQTASFTNLSLCSPSICLITKFPFPWLLLLLSSSSLLFYYCYYNIIIVIILSLLLFVLSSSLLLLYYYYCYCYY